MLKNQSIPVEKRKHPRIKVNLPATYYSLQTSVDSYVSNLSQEGIFLCSPTLDKISTIAQIQLSLPNESTPITLDGKVAWTLNIPGQSGMGLILLNLTRDQRLILANFLIARLYIS